MDHAKLLEDYIKIRKEAETIISKLEHEFYHELTTYALEQVTTICKDLTAIIRKEDLLNQGLALRIDEIEKRLDILENKQSGE